MVMRGIALLALVAGAAAFGASHSRAFARRARVAALRATPEMSSTINVGVMCERAAPADAGRRHVTR